MKNYIKKVIWFYRFPFTEDAECPFLIAVFTTAIYIILFPVVLLAVAISEMEGF